MLYTLPLGKSNTMTVTTSGQVGPKWWKEEIAMSKNNYSIYQVNESEAMRGVRFEPLERLLATSGRIDRANYDLVYAEAFDPSVERQTAIQILNELYKKFNLDHPSDFAGRSLSISDIVVLRFDNMISAHYVDSRAYFSEVPEFLDGPYKYYSTQRPVDIGTFPKTEGGPEHIENYDVDIRRPVEDGRFNAWGHLDYSAPLTEKQIEDYELRPAFDNPDLFRYPPRQLDAQLQVVGRWEVEKGIPEAKRFAELQPDTDRFKLKEAQNRWPVNVRFKRIKAEQGRPSITAQLEQGAKQAAKNNATRPIPSKDTSKDR